ncbi:LysR family transcriptional regulator [Spirillospora sp. NBC_00431]
MPDLRQLRTFVAVAEELNFTRAAERLFLTQQTVSKVVRQLEDELDVILLERTTHRVRLTDAGETLLTEGRTALNAADTAFQRAREFGRGLTGTVTIGATSAIGTAEREEAVQILRDGAPRLTVSMLQIRSRDIEHSLRDLKVDLVLARSAYAGREVRSVPLRPTPAVLCVPDSHPLATARSVRLAQIDGARLLTWNPPGTPYTDTLLSRLAAAGCTVEPVRAQVTGVSTLPDLEELGAVALMPARWPHIDGITQIPLEDDVSLPLVMLTHGKPTQAVSRIRSGMAPSRNR